MGADIAEPGADQGNMLETPALPDHRRYIFRLQIVFRRREPANRMARAKQHQGQEGARQQGLSRFLIEMRSPGVTVKPIPYLNGSTDHFAEVVLDGDEPVALFRLDPVPST